MRLHRGPRALRACMRCGSLDLRPIKALDGGAVPGYQFDVDHCKACGWQGVPLEFEDETSWRAFVEALRADRGEAGLPQ